MNSVALVNRSFPTVRTAKDRATVNVVSWQSFAKANGITKETPKAKVKEWQVAFMSEKREAQREIKNIGALLMASDEYAGKKLQTWTDKKGIRQFTISGHQVEKEEITPEQAKAAASTLSDEALLAIMEARQEEALKKAALEAESNTNILEIADAAAEKALKEVLSTN